MPALTLLLSLVVLSQSAIFVRMAEASAAVIGFWRMAISLPVLLVLLLWKKRGREVTGLRSGQWWQLALCGFFLFLHFYTWFLAVQNTSLAHAMILFCANPLFTAIGAWIFFGEKAGPRHALAILLCFAGIYCLLSEEAAIHSLEGDLLGIACSILFSAYVLMSKGLRRHVQNVPFALVTYSFVTLYFFGAVIALDLPFVGYSEKTWASFVALAFGSTLLGHSLFTQCLQYFPVNFLSIATMVEPALTAVSGYFLFGEAVTKAGMVGFVLVALGILSLFIPWLKPSSRAVEKP